jgi:TetR/AcrR family transcriptional regulator, transcriptional repressor for nem operon
MTHRHAHVHAQFLEAQHRSESPARPQHDPELALGLASYYDAHHITLFAMPRTTSSRKDATHERIVAAAARAIRRSGYNGTGVADIMKEAGLTHGGFYAHFPSREAMLVEAADRASAESTADSARIAASVPPRQALSALVGRYLSKAHIESAEDGCVVAALASEMPRQTRQVRKAATRHIKEMIDLVARQLPNWGKANAHERALVTVATMVGAVELARAVDDPKLADAFREAALKYLVSAND